MLVSDSIKDELFSNVRLLFVLTNLRISLSNAMSSKYISVEARETLINIAETIRRSEKVIVKYIEELLNEFDIYTEFLKKVKGIGPVISGKLIFFIKDIERFPTVAKLWRYAGLGVDDDGKAERMRKGQKPRFNPRFKGLMYNVGVVLVRSKSKYKRIYDKAKEYYQANRDWTKSHIHLAAMRKMEKLFLSHVWMVWRELEGLPVRDPYPVEYLGHSTILYPWEFIED